MGEWGTALTCMILLVAGCGGSGGGADSQAENNVFIKQPDYGRVIYADGAVGEAYNPRANCNNLPDFTGRAYLLTTLATAGNGDRLSRLWQGFDQPAPPTVLYVVNHFVEDKTLHFRTAPAHVGTGGDGKPTKVVFAGTATEFSATLTGCKMAMNFPFQMSIMLATTSVPMALADVTGSASIETDGSAITNGKLRGVIPEEATFDACALVPGLGTLNFHNFMNMTTTCPNADLDDDEVCDGYLFEAEFEAVEVTDAFDPTGYQSIDPIVGGCEAHDSPCHDDCVSCITYSKCSLECGYEPADGVAGFKLDCSEAVQCASFAPWEGVNYFSSFADCTANVTGENPVPINDLRCCEKGLLVDCCFGFKVDGTISEMSCTHDDTGEVACAVGPPPACQ